MNVRLKLGEMLETVVSDVTQHCLLITHEQHQQLKEWHWWLVSHYCQSISDLLCLIALLMHCTEWPRKKKLYKDLCTIILQAFAKWRCIKLLCAVFFWITVCKNRAYVKVLSVYLLHFYQEGYITADMTLQLVNIDQRRRKQTRIGGEYPLPAPFLPLSFRFPPSFFPSFPSLAPSLPFPLPTLAPPLSCTLPILLEVGPLKSS